MGTSEHRVQFYEADAFLLDVVKDVIGATLRAGDVGIVIATLAQCVGIEGRLRADGLDVVGARLRPLRGGGRGGNAVQSHGRRGAGARALQGRRGRRRED